MNTVKKKLLYQPLRVGEIYANGDRLYRVDSIGGECLRPTVHLRRMRDGWELDAVGAALYSTERGVQLLWDWSKNGHFGTMEKTT